MRRHGSLWYANIFARQSDLVQIMEDYGDAVSTILAFINSTDGYGNVSLETLISSMTLENWTDELSNPIRSFNFFQSSSLFPT